MLGASLTLTNKLQVQLHSGLASLHCIACYCTGLPNPNPNPLNP